MKTAKETVNREPAEGWGEQGYTVCSLPTKTPSVAAGDLLKPFTVSHDYTPPSGKTKQELLGMAPRLEQNDGEYKAFGNGAETFKDSDAEWKR